MTATRSIPRVAPRPETAHDGFGPPPRPRPTRNVAGMLLGVVLVVFCAAGVAAFTASIGHRRSVLVVVRPVSAGSVIRDADLGEARLPPDPAVRTVGAGQRSHVVGRVAGVNLVAGTLVAEGELASGPRVDAAHAIVGVALKAGQFPTGLGPLDAVTVVETSPPSSLGPVDAVVVVDNAEVISSAIAADAQTTVVSVLVPRTVAPAVAGAAARGQISLVLVSGTR
ncbi:MAG: SAF domain-containing protein [Actinomycetota bacterium]|nr:SAF domain-containing protein [Actinomycetota bacterium]